MEAEADKRDIIIVGSGPAGYTAAIYAARAMLNPLLIKGIQPGGQLTTTKSVENFPAFTNIDGTQLMQNMEDQAVFYGTKVVQDHIKQVDFSNNKGYILVGNAGKRYLAKAVILATGSSAKWLGLETEKKFLGAGVSACATCDGFFFKNRDVIVIGGGNTAAEEALYLSSLCKTVTIVYRGSKLKSEKILINRIKKAANIKVMYKKILIELKGQENPKSVTQALIKDLDTEKITTIDCEGCFIAIGHKPNTDIFKNQIELDNNGYIKTRPAFSPFTSKVGVFAAGDVQDNIYRQAVTAAGSGCMAALEAMKYLKNS